MEEGYSGEEVKPIALECHGVKPPADEKGLPSRVIDLDDEQIVTVLNRNSHQLAQRADCFIIYSEATAVMEIKRSYPEKAIPQLRKTAELLRNKWENFLVVCGLDGSTPRPSRYYFYAEEGLGYSRYETDSNGLLRERSNAGKNKGPVQFAEDSIPIKVYTKSEIDSSYRWYQGR